MPPRIFRSITLALADAGERRRSGQHDQCDRGDCDLLHDTLLSVNSDSYAMTCCRWAIMKRGITFICWSWGKSTHMPIAHSADEHTSCMVGTFRNDAANTTCQLGRPDQAGLSNRVECRGLLEALKLELLNPAVCQFGMGAFIDGLRHQYLTGGCRRMRPRR